MVDKVPNGIAVIRDVDKARLVMFLYNHARPATPADWEQYDSKQMVIDDALTVVHNLRDNKPAFDDGKHVAHDGKIILDHVKGRCIKMNINGDYTDTTTYNKMYGANMAESLIEMARAVDSYV